MKPRLENFLIEKLRKVFTITDNLDCTNIDDGYIYIDVLVVI